MNIFRKIALQGLIKSYSRTIVTIIGVVLSAAMITAVTIFGISLLDYMARGAEVKYGNWHVAFYHVDASFAQQQAADAGTQDTTVIENIGYAPLAGSENPDKPYLFIAGLNEMSSEMLPIRLLSGRMPENSSELLISASVRANGGVQIPVGETITLAVGTRMSGERVLSQHDAYSSSDETFTAGEERTYTVVGICQRPSFEETSAPGYTVLTKADTQDAAGSFCLFVKLKEPRKVRAYVDSHAQGHDYVLNDNVLRFMGISGEKLFHMLLFAVGGIVIAIIMIGSVFLIYNAFHISLNERMHQFGILLSVGATEKQLRNSVLFEGLCIGGIGIPIGVLAGLGGIGVVMAAVSENFVNVLYDGVPLQVVLSVPAIAAAILVSLVTILISAYIPARKAAKTPVMECIRQINEVKVDHRDVNISGLAGRVYGLEGMLALKNFKRNKRRYRSIVLSLVLSVVLFIATNGFVIDLKQASEMAIVFTTYDIGIDAYDMSDKEMLSLYEQLKTAKGVYKSLYQEVFRYTASVAVGQCSEPLQEALGLHTSGEDVALQADIQFLEDAAYVQKVEEAGLPIDEYTGEYAKLIAVAKLDDHAQKLKEVDEFVDMFAEKIVDVRISPPLAEEAEQNEQEPEAAAAEEEAEQHEQEPEVADEDAARKSRELEITCVDIVVEDTLPKLYVEEQLPYTFTVIAPWSRKEALIDSSVQADTKGLTFRSETPTQTASEMEQMILGSGITASYQLYNTGKMFEENTNMIFIANVFAYTFIVLISLIAAANVFNTISTNIKLRRRELAMLRSVGMSEHDFQKMMNYECIFYGMRALLFGLPVSLLACYLIYRGMNAGGATEVTFVLPWAAIGISVFSVLFIVFITMLYSVSKIKKENIIDALRDDLE